MRRVAGLFSPMLRELEQTHYLFPRPDVLGSSATTQVFGIAPTPWEQTLAETVAWWRGRVPVTRG